MHAIAWWWSTRATHRFLPIHRSPSCASLPGAPSSNCAMAPMVSRCCTRLRVMRRSSSSNWWNRRWRRSSSARLEARLMHEVWLIARREYLERVRSRAFLMMTILFPLMISLLIGGSFFAGKLGSGVKEIAIASNDAVLARAVAAEVQKDQKEQSDSAQAKPPEVVSPASDAQRAELNRRVENKTLDGYLWLEQKPGAGAPEVSYISRSSGDLFSLGGMESAVDHGLERKQLLEHGETDAEITAMARHTDIQTMQIREGRLVPSNSLKSFFGAYAMMFLIYFTVVFYGMNVARSVVEEKTSRIFEVLLSTTQPQSLMAGKLLGVGAAG